MTPDEVREFLKGISEEQWHIIFEVSVVLSIIVLFALYFRPSARERRKLERRRRAEAVENYQNELRRSAEAVRNSKIANMVESVSITGFGRFCVFLMILNWFVSLVMYMVGPTITQQMAALLVWIGGNTMFGIGVMANQTRTYQVSRHIHE